MATIKIKGATVNMTECRARELAKLLAQYGDKHDHIFQAEL